MSCAGSYSDRAAAAAGDDFFKIIPRAGEYMLLDATEGNLVSHTLFQAPTGYCCDKGHCVNMTEKERALLKRIKLYLFDMDGTLYLGNRLYGFTADLLKIIRETGRKYLFMTNNSSKSVDSYIIKLKNMGISASKEDFITSSQATAQYLKERYADRQLYVCGTESLKEELRSEGLSVTESVEDTQCIVMGFDTELTFRKLRDVSYLLQTKKEIPYIATNPDYVCPTEFGSVPDCGSVCDMIYNATGKRPLVIGKPAPVMPQIAMKQWGYGKEETAVVGDRIYTDIKSGLNAGITGILVMSGETTPQILQDSPDKPDLVLQDAGEIISALKI